MVTANMDDLVSIFKALGDHNRLKTMRALEGGELCACQVSELLSIAPSTVSRHMMLLLHAGLIESEKRQRWVYYRLAGHEASEPVKKTLGLLRELYRNSEELNKVREEIERIKSINPEQLCKRKKEN